MSITEKPPSQVILDNIPGAAAEGAELLGIRVDDEPPNIVKAINDFLMKERRTPTAGVDKWEGLALPLGSLWGEQLRRQFGWEWSGVIFHEHGNSEAVGIFAPDRSLVVYPFHFILGCLEHDAMPTVLLAFNMMKAGSVPRLPARGFENLMDGVHHIVPPE